jgi:hypothetical protein
MYLNATNYYFYNDGTAYTVLSSTGLGLGMIGAGNLTYRLDVSGSARIQHTNQLILNNPNNNLYGDVSNIFYNVGSGGGHRYTVNSATIATINGIGLGIGTTTPASRLDVSGNINCSNVIQSSRYNFNYSAVPTLTNASLGFRINPTTTPTLPITLASSSAYALTFTSLPIGVYLIQAYAIGTYITTAITNIRLGLNTVNTSPANNFTQQILPVLSTTQVQSIQYNFYLSNTAVTTYYIVFATGASFGVSSVTGFTASFIRIA